MIKVYLIFILTLTSTSAFAVMPPYQRACMDAITNGSGDEVISQESSMRYMKDVLRFQSQRLTDEEAEMAVSVASSYVSGPSLRSFTIFQGEFMAIQDIFRPETAAENIQLVKLFQAISHQPDKKNQALIDIAELNQKINKELFLPHTNIALLKLLILLLKNKSLTKADNPSLVRLVAALQGSYQMPLNIHSYIEKLNDLYEENYFYSNVNDSVVVFENNEEKELLFYLLSDFCQKNLISMEQMVAQIVRNRTGKNQPIIGKDLIKFYSPIPLTTDRAQ